MNTLLSLAKSLYYLCVNLVILIFANFAASILTYTPEQPVATSTVHSKLDYCNSLHQGCKWDVWCRDRDETETSQSRDRDDTKTLEWGDRYETETLEWRYRDETETSVSPVRDETETRRSEQRLETFGWDVQAVTTTSTVQCIGTLLWVCIHVVTMCVLIGHSAVDSN